MNRYGAMAKAHWREWLPARYRSLADPAVHFETLGEEAESEIETLYRAILATEPADLSVSEREGWRATAWHRAEEAILAEMILIDPEPDPAATAAPPASPTMTTAALANLAAEHREEILRDLFEAEEQAGLTEPFESEVEAGTYRSGNDSTPPPGMSTPPSS